MDFLFDRGFVLDNRMLPYKSPVVFGVLHLCLSEAAAIIFILCVPRVHVFDFYIHSG